MTETDQPLTNTSPSDIENSISRGTTALHREAFVAQVYQGPTPPADYLRQIEEIIPGGAERVLCLSEKEQIHRHAVIEARTATETWQIKASLIAGFLAFTFLIAGIIFCAQQGYTSAVVALGGTVAFGVIIQMLRLPQRVKKQTKTDSSKK